MTSHEQRCRMSEILSAKPSTSTSTSSVVNGNVVSSEKSKAKMPEIEMKVDNKQNCEG